MSDWIKLHRAILQSNVFSDSDLLKVWVWMLCRANWKDAQALVGKQVIDLLPGQFIFGRKAAAYELGMDESKVYRLVKMLAKLGNITIRTTNKFSVISISKWAEFQDADEQQMNNTCTTDEQQMNNRRTADEQQMNTDEEYKKDKNIKKDKKDKKYISAEPETASTPPAAPPVISLPLNDGTEHGITQADIDTWSSRYPAVDVLQALRAMQGWCEANPTKRKTARGVRRFVESWLCREQDKPHTEIGSAQGEKRVSKNVSAQNYNQREYDPDEYDKRVLTDLSAFGDGG